ncbi:MAG: polysaccharide biosynthesis/export family protein [Acidiferrobacteraceae bacterium]
MKTSFFLLLTACVLFSGCSTPAAINVPSDAVVRAHRFTAADSALPNPVLADIVAGDTLRITRDAARRPDPRMTLFLVRANGVFSYPFVGRVQAAGRTPGQVAQYISMKLAKIYVDPMVTVNLANDPTSQIYVGGAVARPGAIHFFGATTLDQALISAGGVLPTANSRRVALLRLGSNGRYNVYFVNYANLLKPKEKGREAVMLQPGDIIFVPQSRAGAAADAVNLYGNQLVPFTKSLGIGFNYGSSTLLVR